jgi:hypothetical protein
VRRLVTITFTIFLTIAMLMADAKTYFCATTGDDSNPGTIVKPWKTLQRISSQTLDAGDTVYIRAGTYNSGSASDSPQNSWLIDGKNGNASKWITIAAYPPDFVNGGRVVFNCGDYEHATDHIGIYIQNSSYLKIKGIRVTGIPQKQAGQVCIGWFLVANNDIALENCEADHIGHNGFRHHNTTNATFLNCDAHHIDNPYDAGIQRHGGSDGFGRYDVSNTSENTLYKNCRAWFCSDDGWDLNNSNGTVTFNGCWSFWNGYVQDVFPLTHTQDGVNWGDGNGFKLAGDLSTGASSISRIVKNCVAFENFYNGFDQNMGKFKGEFYYNTVYNCGNIAYAFYTEPGDIGHILKNNVAHQARVFTNAWGTAVLSNNSWQIAKLADSDFQNINSKGADGARQIDGSLPDLLFLKPKPASKIAGIGAR